VFLAIAVDNLADAQSLSETDNDIDELAVQAPLLTEQVRRLMGSKVKSLARHYNYFAVPPVRAQSIAFVCLSVRQHISKFLAHVGCGRDSVLLWRRGDTSCTSGFVNDVIFGSGQASAIRKGRMLRSGSQANITGTKSHVYDTVVMLLTFILLIIVVSIPSPPDSFTPGL